MNGALFAETESVTETQSVVQDDADDDSNIVEKPEDSVSENQPAVQDDAAGDLDTIEESKEGLAEAEDIPEIPQEKVEAVETKTDKDKEKYKKYVDNIVSMLSDRNRVSLALDFSRMKYGGNSFLEYRNGTYVQKRPDSPFLYGLAFQYNFMFLGKNLFINNRWQGSPILGLGLLLDSSLNYGSGGIYSIGAGLEMQFLWIFRAAIGERICFKSNGVFGARGVVDLSAAPPDNFKGITKEDKRANFRFYQFGVSVPVYNKWDVFALCVYSKELLNNSGIEWRQGGTSYRYNPNKNSHKWSITSFRVGAGYKF